MADPITWEALGAGLALLGGGGAATAWIVAEINRARRESSEGRDRLHRRLDALTTEIGQTYVRRDLHAADLRTVHHALEETNRMLTSLAGRVCPYDAGDGRPRSREEDRP
ncbi:hypothetical protein [Roseospira visakhapatnamensis]|uniref:Uncharacterized protein n=1 Tax=Roseospira visakhapatnamensis TaxID=390880 RepID=A0A7W6WB67_9PROT|nr:hypothetical protein [Roseospira visakhapatnamensis]MBB4267739.1 hypothetical protein [Roseospira visakhapatnamensis]